MKTTNEQHVTLHKEAADVLEQAERAGWERANIFTQGWREDQPNYFRWPMIALSCDIDGNYLSIGISTTPGYVTQNIYRYAEVRYNHPIMAPGTVKQLIALIEPPVVSCMCCDALATKVLGNWDVCDVHHEALTGFWPEDEELITCGLL